MSRPYKPSYKTSQPNPGGWITLLIIVVVACALCWPITSGIFNGINNALGGLFESIDSTLSGPQPTLTVAVSPEKAELFTQLVNDFNAKKLKASNGEELRLAAQSFEPEEMIDAALAGNFQALSPDSSIWLDQLDRQYQSAQNTSAGLVGQTVRYAVSPVVIAMWRDAAQQLGWPQKAIGWNDLLNKASLDKNFKWSHPSTSSASGLLATLAEFYAATGKTRGLTVDDVKSPQAQQYVNALEKTVRYYGEGEASIAQNVAEKGRAYLDAFVASEQIVIATNQQPGVDLVAVYPSEGSLWQDHPLALLEAAGLSDLNRETFSAFASYITSPEAQQAILAKGYRPADLNIKIDGASSPINASNGADPTQPQTSLQVPSAAVLDVVRESWLANKRRTNVMLVVDTSGSMEEDDKIENVKEALATFLDQIKSNEERVGLVEFYNDVTERVKISELKNNRSALVRAVNNLDPGGNTALLDGVAAAYERLQQLDDPSRINAIVVMTDGKENASAVSLNQLVTRLQNGNERGVPVVIFAIAYGGDADMDVLQAVTDATGGQTLVGSPETIRKLYKILSTYF
jgi:Ca-activated chloride channel family protein